MQERPPEQPEPTGEILRRLIADVASLTRVYGRAVGEHIGGMARDVATAALMIGAALMLGVFALGLVVALLVLVVAIWLPPYLAALVVFGTITLAMAALVLIGVRRVRRRRAVWAARFEEEVRWLRSLFPRKS
jgi:hypothetical protein